MEITQITIGFISLSYNVVECLFDNLPVNSIGKMYESKNNNPSVIVICELNMNRKTANELILSIKNELKCDYVSFVYSTNEKYKK